MNAIEKRALEPNPNVAVIHEAMQHFPVGSWMRGALDHAAAELAVLHGRCQRAALTPPEGYVLVPVEVQKDADRFRFLASWAGAEFNSERGYLRWYLSRKGRGFASLAETVDQCLTGARPEVP